MNVTTRTRSTIAAAIALAAPIALGGDAHATTHTFTIYLDGAAAVPPNASPGFAHAVVTFDDLSGVMTITGGYTGMSSDVFHVAVFGPSPHCGTGPHMFAITHTGGTVGTFSGSDFADPADVLDDMLYLNVLTTGFTDGEVRAQIKNGESFCDACDGSMPACPCAAGDYNTGCDNAQGTGGVKLSAPIWSPDGFGGGTATFEGSGFPPAGSPTVIVIRGTGKVPTPIPFGDGLRCISTPVVRFGDAFASGGFSTHSFSHGAGTGEFFYQLWYRNTPAGYCTPAAFNLSNGLSLAW